MANPTNAHATVRQRQLAKHLKRLRLKRDLTAEEVEELTGIGPSKLSRLESATVRVKADDARLLAGAYRQSDDEIENLVQAAEEARTSTVMERFVGLSSARTLRGHLELEGDARLIESLTIDLVPGLLQTPDYARALMEGRPDVDPEDIPERIEIRKLRSQRVFEGALGIWAIISEAALRQEIGGRGVLSAQLQHLVDTPKNVTVQVLPFKAGAHASMGAAFHIFHFSSYEPLLYHETIQDPIYQDDQDVVEAYSEIFNSVRATALSPNESTRFISELATELQE